ncbi:MAG: FkbM family methyltransferase [Congregibacter sp.]|nr:FkbM family methyltransferase [Congregibacter sp.]
MTVQAVKHRGSVMDDQAPPLLTLLPVQGLAREVVLQTHSPERDLVARKLHHEKQWEPFETRLWLASQEPGDVVVDVGANLGYYSILSALHDGSAQQIFAFEPAQDNVALLTHNLVLNHCESLVTVVPVALSDRDSSAVLYRSDDNQGDHQIYAGDGPRTHEAISLRHGGDFLGAAVDRIDLLKVDTQGSEHAVINGLLPLLRRSAGHLRILIELTPYSLRLAGSSGRALITSLAELGLPFWIVDHLEHRLVASDAQALSEWADNVDSAAGDRGFMNIFVGYAPHDLCP